MSRIARRISASAASERGAVLVMVTIFAPVAILFAWFVIDFGNAWWHKRHLQVQADAAALAAAQDMWPCSSTSVSSDAQLYGGVTGSSYNTQVGSTSAANIHQVINSRTFYNQSTPVDSSVNTNPPCNPGGGTPMVDVKMTETNLPWFIKAVRSAFQGAQYINAQARVELRQETTTGPGDVPISVNDTRFAAAEAYFIDESTGSVLGAAPLAANGTVNGLAQWTNAAAPYSLTVPTGSNSDVGVRIALSGTNNLTGNMATDCAKGGVSCFVSGSGQLLDVHGFPATGTGSPTSPIARQVVMTPNSCGDQYFMIAASNCSDGVQATLDLGTTPNLNNITVNAVIGNSKSGLTCTYSGTTKLTTCLGNVSIAAGSARNQIDLTIKQGNKTTTLSNVQSTFAGSLNGNSGPVQSLSLYENGIGDTSALGQGTTHSLVIYLGITPGLDVARSETDPPITLRFSGTGSQNQSVSCTPVSIPPNFDPWGASLATGCQGPYALNPTLTCPDNNPLGTDCVQPATGNQQNKVAKALNYRILGSSTASTCTSPNHWTSFPNLPKNDPRIVTAFVTPYGSFQGSGGSTLYPIQFFAAFYITGWQDNGNGFNNPCQGNGGDDPAGGGTIVGHFINYLNLFNTSGGGTSACIPTSLNECIAVLSR